VAQTAQTPAPAAQILVQAAPAPAPVAPAEPPAPKTYKIGDTGPAGGLIFYDKGNNSGGWRYLEAAPEDIGPLPMSREQIWFGSSEERAVGKGKSNTQAIMREANSRGGGFGWAAQAVDTLVVNGFDDWFIPSQDELNYMWGNLHQHGLGSFYDGWYWSSTFHNQYGLHSSRSHDHFVSEDFSSGTQRLAGPGEQRLVRACRQF
jgi:hypothetical protein